MSSSAREMYIVVALIASIVALISYDLLRNVLAVLLDGRPQELWLLDASRSLYAQDFVSNAFVTLFIGVSLWFVIDFSLHFADRFPKEGSQRHERGQSNPLLGKLVRLFG